MLKKVIDRYRYKKIQTFTYFIPAPPARKTGYREKSFDQVIDDLVTMGFTILDLKTCPISTKTTPGLWVIITIQSTNKKTFNLKVSDFPIEMQGDKTKQAQELSKLNSEQHAIELLPLNDEDIGEVYQID